MATFIGTYVNKVDGKGRVSVPARFRSAVAGQDYNGVVVAPDFQAGGIDACDFARIERLAADLDLPGRYSRKEHDQATRILALSAELPFDENGRVLLPEKMRKHAGISDKAVFVGMGSTFRIWSPERHEAFANAVPDEDSEVASLRHLPVARDGAT